MPCRTPGTPRQTQRWRPLQCLPPQSHTNVAQSRSQGRTRAESEDSTCCVMGSVAIYNGGDTRGIAWHPATTTHQLLRCTHWRPRVLPSTRRNASAVTLLHTTTMSATDPSTKAHKNHTSHPRECPPGARASACAAAAHRWWGRRHVRARPAPAHPCSCHPVAPGCGPPAWRRPCAGTPPHQPWPPDAAEWSDGRGQMGIHMPG